MGIDAFVVYDREAPPHTFAERFLSSADFTVEQLRNIVREYRLRGASGSKAELAYTIMSSIDKIPFEVLATRAVHHLPARTKEWMSVKTGSIRNVRQLADPTELMMQLGTETWYGPLARADDLPEASWYIRPVFVKHYEKDANNQVQERIIRWLCFARATGTTLSLHWRGFSVGELSGDAGTTTPKRTHPFPHWLHVPQLFEELEAQLGARVEYVNLQRLTLHTLWDQYLTNDQYQWRHRRIRAEAGGVTLNARAGAAVVEIGTGGIEHLAATVRKAIQDELATRYAYMLPVPQRIDEVILRTLIREYGALSYEFTLEGHHAIFHGHVYFGGKPGGILQDRFPHVRLINSTIGELNQLTFLLEHT